jgi:hypothetical protein
LEFPPRYELAGIIGSVAGHFTGKAVRAPFRLLRGVWVMEIWSRE